MSNANTVVDERQQNVSKNADAIASQTPNISASVQNQIQSNVYIEPSKEQSGVQQQYGQQSNSTLEPFVKNFATIQQSDNNTIPNLHPPPEAQTNLPSTQPTIEPLLNLNLAQGDNESPDGGSIAPEATANQVSEQKSQQTSPQKSSVTKVKLSDELNIFDWFRTTDIINQIAEKARISVDSVITVLDPGMKEYLYSGGNVNIIVISESDSFVGPIRDVFQTVFGRATVTPAKINSQESMNYPINLARGFNEAIKVAQERIKILRLDTSHVPQNQVMIAVQPSIVYPIDNDSDNLDGITAGETCYFTYCLFLEDPVLGLTLTSYSQLIPLDGDIINTLNASELPTDHPHQKLGYTISIGSLMNSRLKIEDQEDLECQWLKQWAGLDISHVIYQMSLTLAHMYRRKWTTCLS